MDLNRLREPSEPPEVLERLFTGVLDQIELVSNVRAGRVGKDSGRVKPGSSPPRKMGEDVQRKLRDRYDAANNNHDRLRVIKQAQQALHQLKYSPDRSKVRGTLDWKIAIAKDPRTSSVIARVYNISPSYVRKLRARYKN